MINKKERASQSAFEKRKQRAISKTYDLCVTEIKRRGLPYEPPEVI